MSLSEEMRVRLVQKALYYDFVLYNMQQKPFGVLLAQNGGAIKNSERGLMKHKNDASAPMITTDIVGTLHDTLTMCLKNKSTCNVSELQESVELIEELLYNNSKIDNFKRATKTTPAELYDLLNPGNGNINEAIQTAARKIMAYEPSHRMMYLGNNDDVVKLITTGNAKEFLNGSAVEAILSILTDDLRRIDNAIASGIASGLIPAELARSRPPRHSIGGHKRRRATKVRGRKSKRRACKRTRRH